MVKPKLTRKEAYSIWKEHKEKPINVSKKARELGVSRTTLANKFRGIERAIKFNNLENYLAYRWKSGIGWSISIWSPDHPQNTSDNRTLSD